MLTIDLILEFIIFHYELPVFLMWNDYHLLNFEIKILWTEI